MSTLHHLIDLDWMREAYRLTRKDGAPGIAAGLVAGEAFSVDAPRDMKAEQVDAVVVIGFPTVLACKVANVPTVVAFGCGDPVATPLPRSKTPAGPTIPHHTGLVDAAPAQPMATAPAIIISGLLTRLQHLLPTLQERRCRRPGKARFRLAGWPLPGGS